MDDHNAVTLLLKNLHVTGKHTCTCTDGTYKYSINVVKITTGSYNKNKVMWISTALQFSMSEINIEYIYTDIEAHCKWLIFQYYKAGDFHLPQAAILTPLGKSEIKFIKIYHLPVITLVILFFRTCYIFRVVKKLLQINWQASFLQDCGCIHFLSKSVFTVLQ